MIGRRAVAGVALLSALLICAFAAQSAFAAKATNTTAVTCVSVASGAGFSDAHCEKEVGTGAKFAHELVPLNETKSLNATNKSVLNETKESSSIVLKGNPFKTGVEISCKTMKTRTSESAVHNVETEKKHTMTGNGTAEFSECTVAKPPKCTVKEPIVAAATFEGVEGLGAGGNEMGVEFVGAAGGTFGQITLEGAECSLKGKAISVEGSAIGTSTGSQTSKSTGATIVFSPGEMQSIKVGGVAGEVSMTVTPSGSGGSNSPISITTTT